MISYCYGDGEVFLIEGEFRYKAINGEGFVHRCHTLSEAIRWAKGVGR